MVINGGLSPREADAVRGTHMGLSDPYSQGHLPPTKHLRVSQPFTPVAPYLVWSHKRACTTPPARVAHVWEGARAGAGTDSPPLRTSLSGWRGTLVDGAPHASRSVAPSRAGAAPLARLILSGVLVSAMPTDAPHATRALRLPVWGSMRHAAHACYTWTSPVQAGDGFVHVDPPWPRNEPPCVASLDAAFPLLA